MEMQKIEFVFTTDQINQFAAVIARVPTEWGIPLLNILNAADRRAVPVKSEAPAE